MDENIINDLNEELENVIEEGQSMLKDAELQEKFEEIKTEAELLIRKYPIGSVVVAVTAGFLVGRIFK
ncbi:MAG: hypothetical protein JJU13_10210 [Balneolaceae bacterium]|nr:hypothetical protein [Balneolaceae bacterium]